MGVITALQMNIQMIVVTAVSLTLVTAQVEMSPATSSNLGRSLFLSSGVVILPLHIYSFSSKTTQISTVPFFTSTTVTAETWGVRSATSTCNFNFPLINTLPGRAAVFIRFDVRVISFSSVSSYRMGSVNVDPGLRWVLAVVDVGAFGVLNYIFTYKFGEYLGARTPNGDCELHADDTLVFTQLMNMASEQPHLPITEEDRLVSTSGFYSLFDGPFDEEYDEMTVTCHVDLPPLVYLGLFEGYIFINFTIPVYGGSSTLGTVMVEQDVNNTWFFRRLSASVIGYVDDQMRVLVQIGTAYLYNEGYCSVYAVSNNTFDDIVSRLYGDLSMTSMTTMSTTSTTVSGGNVVVLPVQRRVMHEVPGMKNQILCNVTSLWSLRDTNQLACGRWCLSDSKCVSIFFDPGSNTCQAIMYVHTIGNCMETGSSYFIVV